MEIFPGAAEELARLEAAAVVVMAPPSEVSPASRKEAERLFLDLRASRLSPVICKYILETSRNEFVLFEIAQLFGMTVIKEWSKTDKSVIEDSLNFLMKYVAEHLHLPIFVRHEIIQACAKIMKRGIIDKKCGDMGTFLTLISQLLSNEDERMQIFGCELIEALATEFSSSWRGANYGISWDFHFRAKKVFESEGLRQLFELSLQTLRIISNEASLNNENHLNLCDKFLRLAESVLSWNFSSRLPPRLIYCIETNTNAALHPPKSWSHIFRNDETLELFFKLHLVVRSKRELSERSLNVLVQFASLSGAVFGNFAGIVSGQASIHYLTLFIKNFCNLFVNGPAEHEVSGFCSIIYKLFTFQKLVDIARLPEELLSNFLAFIVQQVERLCPVAMQRALAYDDHSYREGLVQIYEAWCVLIRGAQRNQLQIPSEILTFRVLSAFVQTLFSPPLGIRGQLPDANYTEEDMQDDRVLFSDILSVVGGCAVFCVGSFLPMVLSVLKQKLLEYNNYLVSSDLNLASEWREDMHWLFLLIGFSFIDEDTDSECHLPTQLLDYCTETAQSGNAGETNSYLIGCMTFIDRIPSDSRVPPIMQMAGLILAWNAIDHSVLLLKGPEQISPELSRSALWCLERFVSALSIDVGKDESSYAIKLETKSDFSRVLIEFCLHRTFAVLDRMAGEFKLCVDAVKLVVALVDSRATELASNDLLYSCLANVQLDRLPARRSLVRALVLIGGSSISEDLQEKMYVLILKPLREKFETVTVDSSGLESDIMDLLDCFCGVASSSELHSSHFLFQFLSPILIRCSVLLSLRKDSQVLLNAVLELFDVVTRKLAVYLDDKDDTILLYRTILDLLEVYRRDQLSKYQTITSDEEEKADGLATLLDILANVMSKDLLLSALSIDGNVFIYGCRAAFMGLEMLIPIMEDKLLEFPIFCTRFYRLILYLSEMIPSCSSEMSESMWLSIVNLLKVGMEFRYGREVAAISVETVNRLGTFFAQNTDAYSSILLHLLMLFETTFVFCLESSCQLDLFNEAAYALYSLICCNRAVFNDFVNHVLSCEQNASVRGQLESSFSKLLLSEQCHAVRFEKSRFRDRLEAFITETQGLLILN